VTAFDGPTGLRGPDFARRSLRLRLRVWLRREALTEQLAEGRDPDSTAELRLVAGELISTRTQKRIAEALESFLRTAAAPPRPRLSGLPLNRREIWVARDELRALADRLRAGRPVPVHAVALAATLALDGSSPMFGPSSKGSVRLLARKARERLDDPIGGG
jgi:hypothetical protein